MYDIEMSRGYVHGLPDRVGLIKRGGKFFLPDSTGYGGAYERVPGSGFRGFRWVASSCASRAKTAGAAVERDPALLEQSLQSIDLSPAGEPTWEVTTWEGTAEEHHAQDLWVVAQHRRWIEDRGACSRDDSPGSRGHLERKRPAPSSEDPCRVSVLRRSGENIMISSGKSERSCWPIVASLSSHPPLT